MQPTDSKHAAKPCCTPSRSDTTHPVTSTGSVHACGRESVPGVERSWCAVPAGAFTMGDDGPDAVPGDGEGPTREVTLGAFEIGATTVTNNEFAAFVRATRYVTDAERLGASFVFHLQVPEALRLDSRRSVQGLPWWRSVEHASWQRPEGPGTHVSERPAHPVVHVSWDDAAAYCTWAGARLPNEAEWERAARGGLVRRRFPWGDELLDAAGTPRCNVFRGEFPDSPSRGWLAAPVEAQSGQANGFGLFNVCGNVWEWCADAVDKDHRSLRGGSFLCHDSYCNRYRIAARSANTRDTSASNIGFRVLR